jgi:cell division topological specificity factor
MFTALKGLFFGSNKTQNGASSKSLAKSRLSFVLVQDRTGLTPEEMTKFKREMVDVIEKYFEIDEHGFDISYKRETDTTTLLINSPVIVRRRETNRRPAAEAKAEAKTEEKASPEVQAAN